MRYVRYVVLGALAIILLVVAMANRGPVTLSLLPEQLVGLLGFSWQITLPLFALLLGAVLVGVFLGFVWEWLREHKHRADAVHQRREREKLEREVKKTRTTADSTDDVLALLEGTGSPR